MEPIVVYKLLVLSKSLRVKISVGHGKNKLGIWLISSGPQFFFFYQELPKFGARV